MMAGRKHGLHRSAVREALDNLPTGVCFFDRRGIVVLCNWQMYLLVYALTGRDLQSLDEYRSMLESDPVNGTRDGGLFLLDGSAWRFSEAAVTGDGGAVYTQALASDVSELYRRQEELRRDNRALEQTALRLRRLSADVVAVTREEEILRMKMRVHDDIGRSLLATRQLLQQHRPTAELDLGAWKNAIRLLRGGGGETGEKDAMAQLVQAAAGIGVAIRTDGALPADPKAAYLLVTAMRECATNAARHAGATELYVQIRVCGEAATAVLTNNGAAPVEEIREGGGLSSLRARIEASGGAMRVSSEPVFSLTVSIPTEREGTICTAY